MTKPEDFQQQNKVVLDYHSKYKINIHYLSQVIKDSINSNKWDFPDSPGVKNLHFHCRGAWVQSLVRELISHMPCNSVKKEKKTHNSNKSHCKYILLLRCDENDNLPLWSSSSKPINCSFHEENA